MFDEDTENEDSPLSMAGEEDETPQVAGLTQLSTEQFAPDEGYRRIIKANEEARNFSKQLLEQYLALMDKATKKLLAKPTKLTGRERLDMILETLSKRPTDTSDPRFFERKNIGTFLRDIGEAGTAMSKEERERIEKRDADLQALEEMKLKFLMPRAEKEEQRTLQELIREEQRRARAAQKPRLSTSAQEIIDLQTVISNQSLSQEQRDAASRKLAKIGADSSQEDKSVLGQISRATQMVLSNDPEKVRIGQSVLNYFNRERGLNLNLSQLRTDEQIRKSKEFLKDISEQELKAALNAPFPNARQKLIIEAYKLSREPTFESVLPQSGFSAEPIED